MVALVPALGAGVLTAPHGGVATIGGHELVVAPALDDPTAVHDEDLIGVAHGRQAVGDDDDGATRRQAGQGPMNVPLGGGVGLGGGLVQKEDRGVLEVGPGKGDTLLLTAREEPSLLSQDGVVAPRQARDALMDAGGARRGLDLLAGGPRCG